LGKRNKRHRGHGERRFSPEEQGLYERYKDKRTFLIQRYGSRCYVCHRTNDRLEFHHLKYHENGKYEKNSTLYRRMMVLDEIERYSNDFILLCRPCHSCITWLRTLMEEEEARLVATLRATF